MALASLAPTSALDGDAADLGAVSAPCTARQILKHHVANLFLEEPDAGILQVRICGGPGKATTRGYPAAWPSTSGCRRRFIDLDPEKKRLSTTRT